MVLNFSSTALLADFLHCQCDLLASCHFVLPATHVAGTKRPPRMKTIAIVSQKGGAGKTTLALHLACAAQAGGFQSAIIDLDPQASAAAWHDSREAEAPVVVALPYTRLAQALEAARKGGAALVVVDTAPHSEAAAVAAARAADLVLIPCRAGILDLRAIGTTAQLVKLARKPAWVVLNAYHPSASQLLEDARSAVAVHGLAVAPVGLAMRAAFYHSLTAGLTATEYAPQDRASQEIHALFAWAQQQLGALTASWYEQRGGFPRVYCQTWKWAISWTRCQYDLLAMCQTDIVSCLLRMLLVSALTANRFAGNVS